MYPEDGYDFIMSCYCEQNTDAFTPSNFTAYTILFGVLDNARTEDAENSEWRAVYQKQKKKLAKEIDGLQNRISRTGFIYHCMVAGTRQNYFQKQIKENSEVSCYSGNKNTTINSLKSFCSK